MLVDLGVVNAEQVAKTRAEAQSSNVGVVDLLLANKLIRPADVTQAKAAQFGAEVIQLGGIKIPDEVISIIPRNIAKKYRVITVFKTDGKVAIAIADPSDLNTIDTLTHLLNAEIELRVASEPDIEAALGRYYGGRGDTVVDKAIQELTQSEVEMPVLSGRNEHSPRRRPHRRRRCPSSRCRNANRTHTIRDSTSSWTRQRSHR